ncbi:hypothetical protein HDU86_001779, partial [Geranomyces michiganensis]
MSITARMLSLRGALLQALLHSSGEQPSSGGVATGYVGPALEEGILSEKEYELHDLEMGPGKKSLPGSLKACR